MKQGSKKLHFLTHWICTVRKDSRIRNIRIMSSQPAIWYWSNQQASKSAQHSHFHHEMERKRGCFFQLTEPLILLLVDSAWWQFALITRVFNPSLSLSEAICNPSSTLQIYHSSVKLSIWPFIELYKSNAIPSWLSIAISTVEVDEKTCHPWVLWLDGAKLSGITFNTHAIVAALLTLSPQFQMFCGKIS